jgi:sarcosine oxidase
VTVVDADAVVVGAGSVGSMAAWQLAARGMAVVAIDRFPVPGPFSAYAGETRVFRMVYAEGGHYTPLLQRGRDLWRELEAASGASLLEVTGVVTITDNDHPDHAALLLAGRERGLSFEVASGEEAQRRLPQHAVRPGDVVLFDPEGGYVRSERAVFSAVQVARCHGARFLGSRRVSALDRDGNGWRVRTDQEEVRAPRVLIATGTGARPVCAALGTHLAVLPQVLTWFPIADPGLLRRTPEQTFIRSSRDARFYGFPSTDGWTVKVAASIYLDDAESTDRPYTFDPRHLDTVQAWVGEFLPALAPRPVRAVVCADGYTPDETGLLGPVPGMDGVVVAAGFSGHGFKMASSLGAVAADLIADGQTATDVSFMNPARYLPPGATVETLPGGGAAAGREA